jgi:lipopolysaccharide transport system permease protein
VRYRDIRYVVPFMLQTWLFITPVVYSSRMVDPTWQFIYSLNPMTGVVEGFRWALFHSGNFTPTMLIVSCASAVILLFTGLIYFRRGEGRFADMI